VNTWSSRSVARYWSSRVRRNKTHHGRVAVPLFFSPVDRMCNLSSRFIRCFLFTWKNALQNRYIQIEKNGLSGPPWRTSDAVSKVVSASLYVNVMGVYKMVNKRGYKSSGKRVYIDLKSQLLGMWWKAAVRSTKSKNKGCCPLFVGLFSWCRFRRWYRDSF